MCVELNSKQEKKKKTFSKENKKTKKTKKKAVEREIFDFKTNTQKKTNLSLPLSHRQHPAYAFNKVTSDTKTTTRTHEYVIYRRL